MKFPRISKRLGFDARVFRIGKLYIFEFAGISSYKEMELRNGMTPKLSSSEMWKLLLK